MMIISKKITVTKNKKAIVGQFENELANKESLKKHVKSGMPLKTFKPKNA